jgi:hypothetical protein
VLSDDVRRTIDALFPEDDRDRAAQILDEGCNRNVFILKDATDAHLERVQMAAVKVSEGRSDKLEYAVDLAQKDWRDLLMYAEFGTDADAHKSWLSRLITSTIRSRVYRASRQRSPDET